MSKAGSFRHRIQIERPLDVQDPVTGAIEREWQTAYADVPAAIEPLSVREFLSAQQPQSNVTVRVVIRYMPDLTPNMRFRYGTRILNPAGFFADKESGLDYLTAPCSEGVNDG